AGDVFGNGMLLSKHIRLQAAFNHLHIFIDPNPDAAITYPERERLFNLPRSSWEDYDKSLISEGGGVFSRKAKSVKLTPQIQAMLATDKTSMTPNELIQNLLKMPVDLLWNGGIGTYVKASQETHSDVGDRANDVLRINGSELGAKIVGEGGNLGMTQKARIEYALHGGRVNTDFVDNVGGVDCSDNEVNIKVLLNGLVASGDLTMKQRNQILDQMEDEVGDIVLDDAYTQAESISVTQWQGCEQVKSQVRFIHALEKMDKLDRQLENLPDDETMTEREKQGVGLTRPELAVLVAYSKMVLKEQLAVDSVTHQPLYASRLTQYFPTQLREPYHQPMLSHPLKSEIIATSLANQVVNEMGANFVIRLQDETGASVEQVVNAYSCAREIYDFDGVFHAIRELDNHVASDVQYELLVEVRRMIRRGSRWLLRNQALSSDLAGVIARYQADARWVAEHLDELLVDSEIQEHQEQAQVWIDAGVTVSLAQRLSKLSSLYSAFDIKQVAETANVSIEVAAKLYFALGSRLSLHWFLKQINQQSVDNHWQALARASFREDLDWQQRQLTTLVLQCGDVKVPQDVSHGLELWISKNKVA
ncbi:MAG: NAD-glutamate dehydrogenase domain-containing protein, partial [Vibrio sp.]